MTNPKEPEIEYDDCGVETQDSWARRNAIARKKELSDAETAGFQRAVDELKQGRYFSAAHWLAARIRVRESERGDR